MLDIFAVFATDEKLENEGVWKDIGQGTELLVARTGNRAYGNELTKLVEANKDVLDERKDDKPTPAADAMSDSIMVDVLAATVLRGWRTKRPDGTYVGDLLYRKKPLSYSVENAKLLLSHKDFRQKVVGIATEIDNYRVKEEVQQGEA